MRPPQSRRVLVSLLLFAALALQGCRGVDFWRQALGVSIAPIDFSHVEAGVYLGAYENGAAARVKVRVAGHRVVEVAILEHKTQLGRKAESLAEAIVRKQSLEVDTVSGATMSSLVILKAVEQALLQGL